MINLDWKNLPFGYVKTNYNIRCYYRDGKWGELEISSSEYINLHMAATCLHYGQEAFEGIKAFRGRDNKIRIFRWQENSKRMSASAEYLLLASVPDTVFREAIFKAVKLNEEFIPPYGTGASLYIRPLLIGSSAKVGVSPSNETLFVVFVTPVGPYFKGGLKPVDMVISRDSDRAAPNGSGHVKTGGNYASSLLKVENAHHDGYASVIYLDPKERKYIDECAAANFYGIKNSTYVTPDSATILPSVINKSIVQLAEDIGLKVERRQILVDELDTFEETGACGTATIMSPIKKIVDPSKNKVYEYCKNDTVGPVTKKLYDKLTNIQFGDESDLHGWIEII